jgi:hypothetical protein
VNNFSAALTILRPRSSFCRSRNPTGPAFKDESIRYFTALIGVVVNKAE